MIAVDKLEIKKTTQSSLSLSLSLSLSVCYLERVSVCVVVRACVCRKVLVFESRTLFEGKMTLVMFDTKARYQRL